MTPEQTLQKAIEIARSKWRTSNVTDARNEHEYELGDFYDMLWIYWVTPIECILFDRSFREALVGKKFVYPQDIEFTTTWYLRYTMQKWAVEIEIHKPEYHMMMCAKSDDRIWYLQYVLDSLENK